jgi:hypothetical protein
VAKVPWHLFQERKPRAHLVVGAIFEANEPAGLADSTAALAVLRRLARKQDPAGDYAAAVMRDAGWPEVYFAFNEEADAQKFAAAVEAEPIERLAGWASRRAFEMDATRIRALEALLPPSRKPPDKKGPWEPLRRGPRASVRRYDE